MHLNRLADQATRKYSGEWYATKEQNCYLHDYLIRVPNRATPLGEKAIRSDFVNGYNGDYSPKEVYQLA